MNTRMHCLGIESTAHTFGVGIASNQGKILANEKTSFTSSETGIVPREVARFLEQNSQTTINQALEKASLTMNEISLISYSQGPGIGNCLQAGLNAVKKLAKKNNLPVVGVNHCIAHLEIGRLLTKARDPILLYASGANTQIIAFEGGKYRIFGETLDIGIGNLLDKFARHVGLGFPGGPALEKLYYKAKNFIPLPYTVKGMDLAFSGLLTRAKQLADSNKHSKQDLAYSLQETAFSMLVEVAERALAHCTKKELLLGGGVACSKILQEKTRIMCKERGAKLFVPADEFLVDNGAMIAWQGLLQKSQATRDYDSLEILPYQRTDEVKVTWRK